MPNTNPTIATQANLSNTIELTRTSPAFTPEARVYALKNLLRGCTLSINTCYSAYTSALRKIFESKRYREQLDAMTDLSPEDRHIWTSMTDRVLSESLAEMEQIRRELNALRECREKAEEAVREVDKKLISE